MWASSSGGVGTANGASHDRTNNIQMTWTDKKGKPLDHDPDFRGPLERRSCTDVLCCVIFAAFIVGWAVLAVFALMKGDPRRILYPTDSQGRVCGVKGNGYDLSDRPYLFFFDLTQCASYSTLIDGCPTPQPLKCVIGGMWPYGNGKYYVCVSGCPTDYYYYVKSIQQAYCDTSGSTESNVPTCNDLDHSVLPYCERYDANFNDLTLSGMSDLGKKIDQDLCPQYYLPETAVLDRCVPSIIVNAVEGATHEIDKYANKSARTMPNSTTVLSETTFIELLLDIKEVGEKIFKDFKTVWWIILIALCISMIVSFIWIVLLRWIAAPMVWLSILLLFILLGGATAFCWWKWYDLKNGQGTEMKFTTHISSYLEMTNTWLAFAIIVSVVFAIIFLIVLFLRSRIRIAIALIKESSRALSSMTSVLFFPIVPFLLHLIVIGFWAIIAVYIASIGQPTCQYMNGTNVTLPSGVKEGDSCDCTLLATANATSGCFFTDYQADPNLLRAQIYNVFGLFWLMFFVSGVCELTMAGAFASYYWAYRKPDDIPALPLLKSFGRTISFHLGSVAFGSLILAIVRMIRLMLEYAEKKLKKYENPVTKVVLKCLKCCFWCLEKCLRFLTKNAYIIIAIYGKNFCVSAKEAFMLILRNFVRVFILDKVTDFLLFIGKLVVVVGMGLLSFYVFSGRVAFTQTYVQNLNYYFVPIFVIIVGTYMICSGFFSVYEMAVDTTFLCFLEDSERNDGSPEKPYFMSKELMKILDKSNSFKKDGR